MANVKFIRASDAILGIDDLDSIRLPPGENFGIISDDEDLQQELEELENETGFANIIVVDNLPKVPKEKIGKLEAVIHQQINSKIGFLIDSRLKWKMSWMPIDPSTERTRGYYFIEYNTPRGHAHEFGIRGPGGVIGVSWPVFRWVGGKDDKYFARIGKDFISVYETETFTLIDQKSIKVANVMDVCWSPTDPILALFVPEHDGGNQPARVSLVQIPSKEKVRQKILFSVSDCKMYWQSNGDYLAVKVDRYTKTKKIFVAR